ncbi:MAG: helix-turn-helix transcriptional regulator [Raoultibacter sp.]
MTFFKEQVQLGSVIGAASSFAFIGYTLFSQNISQGVSISFAWLDMAYITSFVTTALMLIYVRKNDGIAPGNVVFWISCIVLFFMLVAFTILMIYQITFPPLMKLATGVIVGIYLPFAILSWLRINACNRLSVVAWNLLFVVLLGSFFTWLFTGMEALQLGVSYCLLLFVGTISATVRLRAMNGAKDTKTRTKQKFIVSKNPFFAAFLFNFAFSVVASYVNSEGYSTLLTAGVMIVPFFIVYAVVLALKSLTSFSLLNIAVSAIATLTILVSFLEVFSPISYDFAVLGLFLFLLYTIILLCASAQGKDRPATYSFLLLMLSFFGGFAASRMVSALIVMFEGSVRFDFMIFLSVLAVVCAMVLCVNTSRVLKQVGELFHYEDDKNMESLFSHEQTALIEETACTKNLGAREKEALILLLLKKSASEVAAEMVIANGTAKSHIRHLYKKLNVHSRDELFELFNIV